jgi:hypothetical protein
VNQVADAADIHHHLIRAFVGERAAKLRDHLLGPGSRLWRARRQGVNAALWATANS